MAPNEPPWRGGWAGYLSYELGLAHPLSEPSDSTGKLCFFPYIFAFSHSCKTWHHCAIAPSATIHDVSDAIAKSQIERLLAQIASAKNDTLPRNLNPKYETVRSSLTPEKYCQHVATVLDFIRAGDVYQLNLAQRLEAPWAGSAEEFYLALREQSPAQFGAFIGAPLTGGSGAIASISPELLLRTRGMKAETRPIKGTRPRPANPQQAAAFEQELLHSEKERAELNMIVDLERNDLGRVCEYGSVHVRSAGEIETLPTLLHRVATIEGTLKSGTRITDLMKAIFPGGSITGAPKCRAMQIIRELEPVPRGPYCGAIGWLDLHGDMELNLAIRTAVCDAEVGIVRYHAGSGIVADSDPVKEYDETLQKSAAFLRAVNGTLAPSGSSEK